MNSAFGLIYLDLISLSRHCIDYIMMGSFKVRGNQSRFCIVNSQTLLSNYQLFRIGSGPGFRGLNHLPQRWKVSVLPTTSLTPPPPPPPTVQSDYWKYTSVVYHIANNHSIWLAWFGPADFKFWGVSSIDLQIFHWTWDWNTCNISIRALSKCRLLTWSNNMVALLKNSDGWIQIIVMSQYVTLSTALSQQDYDCNESDFG